MGDGKEIPLVVPLDWVTREASLGSDIFMETWRAVRKLPCEDDGVNIPTERVQPGTNP